MKSGRLVAVATWLCLAAWLSVLVAAAISATFTFAVLTHLDIDVSGLPWTDSADHGRYAAGRVMEPIFFTVDLMQVIAAGGLVITLLARAIMQDPPWRGSLGLLRTIAVAIALGSFGGRAVLLTPKMNTELRAMWGAAEAGDIDTANVHRAAFDRYHPTASRLYQVTLFAVFGTIILTAMADTAPRTRPDLGEPALLRGA
ncbi:MAG: hypothetical protein ACYTGR_03635, partial [Planctomycetota bacterium]